jgi:dihydroorotate dehydrogenase electron transfer subunit
MLTVTRTKEIFDVAHNVKTFKLDRKFEFIPGQFVMVWIPRTGEKPFSLADEDMLVVKKVGPFTSKLFELGEGDRLWIRGPYGRGFEPEGERIALVAGGIGIPPLYALAKRWNKKFSGITLVYGAKRKEELALMDVERYVDELVTTTDDGSSGIKGFPTDVLEERKDEFDQVYACGPEAMLKKVLRIMEGTYSIRGNVSR